MAIGRLISTFLVVLLAVISSGITRSAAEQQKHRAKTVALESNAKELPILTGPPQTVSMRSGLIRLQPGEAVGEHTTGHHEEMLIVLEGKGEMRFSDGTRLEVEAGHALYCPPETEHDVVNTGSLPLRYVYVVAKAE